MSEVNTIEVEKCCSGLLPGVVARGCCAGLQMDLVRLNGVGVPPVVTLASRDEIRQNLVLRPDTDIFIVTYPKSGTTWVQNIVRQLLYCSVDAPRFSDMGLNERIPYLDMLGFHASDLEEYPNPRAFKSHNTPAELDTMVLKGSTKAKIIYMMRDPRDAMVSMHSACKKSLEAISQKTFCTLEEFCTVLLRNPKYAWGGLWEEHVDEWLTMRNKYDILVLRYEALKQDPGREIRRVADFLSLSVTEQEVGIVVQKTTLSYMKQDAQVGVLNGNAMSILHKGLIGEWKKEFVGETLEKMAREMGEIVKDIHKKHDLKALT